MIRRAGISSSGFPNLDGSDKSQAQELAPEVFINDITAITLLLISYDCFCSIHSNVWNKLEMWLFVILNG